MSRLAYADLFTIADRMAATYQRLDGGDALGTGGLGDGTNYASLGGANHLSMVLALADAEQEQALLPAAIAIADRLKTVNGAARFFPEVLQALGSHVEGLSAYLLEKYVITDSSGAPTYVIGSDRIGRFDTTGKVALWDASEDKIILTDILDINTVGADNLVLSGSFATSVVDGSDAIVIAQRYPPEFMLLARQLGLPITPTLGWPPDVMVLGNFVASGASSGTFTDGAAIDTGLYGPANTMRARVKTGAIGALDLVLAITGVNQDGDVATGAVTVPALSAVATTWLVVPDTTGDRFTDITNITNSNGTSGDEVDIISKEDRTPSI